MTFAFSEEERLHWGGCIWELSGIPRGGQREGEDILYREERLPLEAVDPVTVGIWLG